MGHAVVYALFVDDKLKGLCASFEIAAALAQEHMAPNIPMRIERAEAPARLQVWVYEYSQGAWVKTK